ncbi:MAG: hypothetical protein MUC63_02310 [Planctomycetes bacterium]|jgi:hypothetical protein|nr:hypothetical protein [Planctomycetota bacterium]
MVISKWERRSVRRAAWAILVAFAAGAGYLAVAQHAPHWIRRSQTFEFYLRRARVDVGTPVWVNGIEAGKVIRMEPEVVSAPYLGGKPQEGKVLGVKVACRILSPFHRLLREGSTVEVVATSIFGGIRVNVTPGLPGSPRSPNGVRLGPRTVRGIEEVTEEFGEHLKAIERRRKEIQVHLDAIEKNVDEIDGKYSRHENTLYAFLAKGPDFQALDEVTRRIEGKSRPLQTNLEGIRADLAFLDRELVRRLREDVQATSLGMTRALDQAQASREPLEAAQARADATLKAADRLNRKIRGFQENFRVFLQTKDQVVPELLAAWKTVQRNLIALAIRRMKLSAREDPNLNQVLERIERPQPPDPKKVK